MAIIKPFSGYSSIMPMPYKELDHEYYERFERPDWKEKREQRLKIDKYSCYVCGCKDNLTIHHLHYYSFGDENAETDLVTLCESCHSAIENKKEEKKKRFTVFSNGRIAAYQARAEWLMRFYEEYGQYDYANFGDANFCDIKQIKKSIHEYSAHSPIPTYSQLNGAGYFEVSFVNNVQEHFRDWRRVNIEKFSEQGYTKTEIKRMFGFSDNMINKYFVKGE